MDANPIMEERDTFLAESQGHAARIVELYKELKTCQSALANLSNAAAIYHGETRLEYNNLARPSCALLEAELNKVKVILG